MQNKLNSYFTVFSIILVLNLFFQIISSDILFLIIFFFIPLFLKRIEIGFIYIVFFGDVIGSFFYDKGISGVGGSFQIIGILMLYKYFLIHKISIIKNYLPLLLILLTFFLSAYFNQSGSDYFLKANQILIKGTIFYLAFSVVFLNINSFNTKGIGQVLLILSLYLLNFIIDLNQIPGPDNLLHFGFIREQTNIFANNAFINKYDFTISYHIPGFFALTSFIFYFFKSKFETNIYSIIFLFFVFLSVYYSGARQNLFVLIFISMFYVFFRNNSYLFTRFIFGFFLVFLIANVIITTDSEVINDVINSSIFDLSETSGRSLHYIYGLNYFYENQLTGIGIGFHDYGNGGKWSHNLFIEILAETGVIGFLIVFTVVFIILFRTFQTSKLTANYLLLFIPFFLRSMISGSLMTNIIVFSFICTAHFWYSKKLV